jgi:hypothetical protein
MKIIDFIQYAGVKVRTAAKDEVTITSIVKEDKFPIKGTYYHSPSKTVNRCEWDEHGYPHNLPLTHGLNLIPYLPETLWNRIDANTFKNAESYVDLVKSS